MTSGPSGKDAGWGVRGLSDPGIHAKLLRSHLRVAGLGLAILLIACVSTLWLRASALRLAHERGPVVQASMRVLSGVQRSIAELRGWVALGDPVFRTRRAAVWQHEIRPSLADLIAASGASDAVPAERLRQLEAMLGRLEQLQARIEDGIVSDGDTARRLMVNDGVPLGHQVTGFLHAISAGQMALMKVDESLVTLVSQGALLTLGLLVGVMVLGAWRVSQQGADRITQPIRALCKATEEIAAGRLHGEIPVESADEIGQLTRSFNGMRVALAERTTQLDHAAGDIGRAVARLASAVNAIVEATQSLDEGAGRQSSHVARVEQTVSAIAAQAGGAAQRARVLLERTDWADSISRVGAKTAEAATLAIEDLDREVDHMTASAQDLLDRARSVMRILESAGSSPPRGAGTGASVEEIRAPLRDLVAEIQRTMHGMVGAAGQATVHMRGVGRIVQRGADTIRSLAAVVTQAHEYASESDRAASELAEAMAEVQRTMEHIRDIAGEVALSTRRVADVGADLGKLAAQLDASLADYRERLGWG